MEGNVETFIDELRQEGFYPSIDPPRFHYFFSLTGRQIMEMENPNRGLGTIYYTLNGKDPQTPGGAPDSGAFEAGDETEIVLEEARMPAGPMLRLTGFRL